MLKTIENAAEVTSTLTFNRHFGPCSETTSGKMVLPVKAGYIIFCSHGLLRQDAQNRMCLACSQKVRFGVK
jgi:hypothetical protein